MIDVIDMRGTPFQPCWECGQLAGGHEAHFYFGNFAYGVEHGNCGERIKVILERSLRALSVFDENSDSQTKEVVTRALITTAARKLNNSILTTLEDHVIRKVVETDGIEAALLVFRGISKLSDTEWDDRLKKHKEIMQGSEIVKKDLTQHDDVVKANLMELIDRGIKAKEFRQNKCNDALAQMVSQFKQLKRVMKNNLSKVPYCIIENEIREYYDNSNVNKLMKLFRDIDALDGVRVIFLGKECQDASYSYITHLIIDHVALMPSVIPFAKAQEFWQSTNDQGESKCKVFTLDCLQWKNYWVFLKEIGERLSVGEGSKDRLSMLTNNML